MLTFIVKMAAAVRQLSSRIGSPWLHLHARALHNVPRQLSKKLPMPYSSPAMGNLTSASDSTTMAGSSAGWEDLWKEGVQAGTCFDVSSTSPALVRFLERHATAIVANSVNPTALVPGCGRGYDLPPLASHGFEVTGLELAETALEAARTYLQPFQTEARADKMVLCAGDFFAQDKQYDLIYDYTFTCGKLRRLRGCVVMSCSSHCHFASSTSVGSPAIGGSIRPFAQAQRCSRYHDISHCGQGR
jgi:hypothetical protein